MIQTKNRGKYRILPEIRRKWAHRRRKTDTFCRRSIGWKKSRASAVPERSPETVSYRAASGRRAHWRDQFRGNHRPDGRKVFVCLPDGRSFLLGSVCGSSRRKRNLRCTDGKRRGRLLLPSPGVPGNAHHLTAPAV